MHSASANEWVQLIQALVARELVERLGLPGREAARRLGLAPSAISQYLGGKRLSPLLTRFGADRSVRTVSRSIAREIANHPPDPVTSRQRILEGAVAASTSSGRGARISKRVRTAEPQLSPGLARQFHRRIAAEQGAVAACMRLAQKARDELTRAVFRQIASDSLRHAEIVASLASSLDGGVAHSYTSGITRRDVERMIAREHAAEEGSEVQIVEGLGGVLALLAGSMEADERKHEALLTGLLQSGFPRGSARPSIPLQD